MREHKCIHCGNFGPGLSGCVNCGNFECARCYGDCLIKCRKCGGRRYKCKGKCKKVKINRRELKKEMKTLQKMAKIMDPQLAGQIDKAVKALPDVGLAKGVVDRILGSGTASLKNYPTMRKLAVAS